MRALDIQDDPAVGSVDDNEVQHDFAVIVDEGDRDIGLVELLAQDLDRDRADPPLRTLDKKIVRRIPGTDPCCPQTPVEELARRGGIARQSVGEIGRAVAVIGLDIPDQRFR